MRNIVLAAALMAALAWPQSAHAATGTYSSDDGPDCSWYSLGEHLFEIDCSGYSRSAREYVSYHCTMEIYPGSSSWNCRDRNGNTWRGSR